MGSGAKHLRVSWCCSSVRQTEQPQPSVKHAAVHAGRACPLLLPTCSWNSISEFGCLRPGMEYSSTFPAQDISPTPSQYFSSQLTCCCAAAESELTNHHARVTENQPMGGSMLLCCSPKSIDIKGVGTIYHARVSCARRLLNPHSYPVYTVLQ